MPTILFTKGAKLEPSVKRKAYTFLEKLSENDVTLGLHIEPIENSADPRVRTGRVDDFYRAVLFKIPVTGDTLYVFHGIWPHDDVIALGQEDRAERQSCHGVTEIKTVEPPAAAVSQPVPPPPVRPPPVRQPEPLLERHGLNASLLVEKLGIDQAIADRAMRAMDDDQLLTVADSAVEWQGLALIDLGAGHTVAEVVDKLELLLEPADPAESEDEKLARGLATPAAQLAFAFIEDNDELRRVIESGDFGAWRVFLHPEQRKYAQRSYNGPFRLSGGAGTGKTVVLLHRARRLVRQSPDARILVTTYTTNLADAVRSDLARLDPDLPRASRLGEKGIFVTGIDAVASAVLRGATADLDPDVQAVLGTAGAVTAGRMVTNPWKAVLDTAGGGLSDALRSEPFFIAEYGTVILPNRVTTREEYLRVRRPGRGVALDRGKRAAVWDVVAACRAQARVNGTLEFAEVSAIASAHLSRRAETAGHLFDHVVVDEGQDLAPTHWQLLRALVGEHPNDLFIAEDSHQRIYGRRIVLGQYGIRIVGRSQRLTLNYRTTAQNLSTALKILQGGDFVDLEEGAEKSGDYRSARTGPEPRLVACSSVSDDLDQAAKIVAAWKEASEAPETIAVLVRDRWQRDRVAAGFAERGVAIRPVDREAVKPGQPVVMIMHRAKGTEFKQVLLFGISEGSIPAALKGQAYSEEAQKDAELRERSLLYVAATRARDELVVTYHGKRSPLITGV